jgi:pantoate--beta-alanine ligase
MQILRTVAELRAWSRTARNAGEFVGLVPTMGALHAGHASLFRAARTQCHRVAASIFVNPTQFSPHEDYARYPRTFDADCALAAREGVDIIFAPAVDELYPDGAVTFVEVEGLTDRLDGASRPGHFRGVATVVTKLLVAAEPDLAFFGQKDAAQIAILRRMLRDLRLATQLVVCPIVREYDGLALSSRNVYLSPEERTEALALNRALNTVEDLVGHGNRDAATLIEAAHAVLGAEPLLRVDYIAAVNWDTLLPVDTTAPGILFAIAAWVGATRLIDNTILA